MKKMIFLTGLILFQSAVCAETFQSSVRQTTLLELYSSEGCSSCPAADDWVRSFRKSSALWKSFVPVVFHVDYWDGLGWKDPFGSSKHTARQEEYARSWRGQTLFTPCVVISGHAFKGWNRIKTLPTFDQSPGILKVEPQGTGRYRVSFEPSDKNPDNFEAHMTLLGLDIESNVAKGENAGKILRHDFIVLDYARTSMAGTSPVSAAISLNTHDSRAKKFAIAAWVTKKGSPLPLQATGGYLS